MRLFYATVAAVGVTLVAIAYDLSTLGIVGGIVCLVLAGAWWGRMPS